MISNDELKARLEGVDGVTLADVHGDGSHYQVVVVSDHFLGKSAVARQQWVYAQLNDLIMSGLVHALQMKTWTNVEWETQHG